MLQQTCLRARPAACLAVVHYIAFLLPATTAFSKHSSWLTHAVSLPAANAIAWTAGIPQAVSKTGLEQTTHKLKHGSCCAAVFLAEWQHA